MSDHEPDMGQRVDALVARIEGLEHINRLQAEALAEERDMNRQLTAALAEARAAPRRGTDRD